MRLGRWALAGVAGWLVAAGTVAAQAAPAPRDSTRVPGADLTVYLMTMGPGALVWERFGHNAIFIHDPARGTDQAYNYGLFDLRQEHFVLRFIQGRMWYWMAGYPAAQYVDQYVRDNRSVWVQELEMPPAARFELQRFLEWNALPEHRFYHYDYYRDNCSTRVRDALDRVLGGRIRAGTDSLATGTTYRFHTQRLTANDPLTYTGLLLALGPGTDRPISAWEEAFLPLKLREHVRAVMVPGPGGGSVPLVRSEDTLFTSSALAPPEAPPRWTPWYLLLGVGIASAIGLLARGAERHRAARLGLGVAIGGWGLACGVAGLILTGLWGFTDHVMAYRNENLFQVNPVGLLLPLLMVPWLRGRPDGGRRLTLVATALAGSSLVGWILQVLPGLDQVNGSIIALALPVHLGIAAALRWGR